MLYVLFSIFLSFVNTNDFYCKPGEKANMPPQPSCGVPVRIRLPLPAGGKRFEFRRTDNPNLSGYFHRKRNGKGPVKRFSNLINLYKVDLFLCPKDFDNPKTLLFHLISHSGVVKKYQCKLGKKENDPFSKAASTTSTQKKSKTTNKQTPYQNTVKKNTVSNSEKSVLSPTLPKPSFPPKPVSPFLITLVWSSIAMSILFFIIFAVAIYLLKKRISKMEKTLDEINEISMTMELPQRKKTD